MPRYIDLNNPKIIHMGRDKFGNGIYHIPPDLPTADVVEQKKGKWIDYPIADGCLQCSVCGILRFGESNFCPNCGAEMGERRENERSDRTEEAAGLP